MKSNIIRIFRYIVTSFFMILCSVVVYGQKCDDIIKAFREGNYNNIIKNVDEYLLNNKLSDNMITTLFDKIQKCDSLKKSIESTDNKHALYDSLYKLNPFDSDARKYIDESKKRQYETNNTRLKYLQKDSIPKLNDTIRTLKDHKAHKDSIIAQQKGLLSQQNDTIKLLKKNVDYWQNKADRLSDSLIESRKSKWEKAREKEFSDIITAEYENHSEAHSILLYKAAYDLCTQGKIDSARTLLNKDTLKNLENKLSSEQLACLYLLSARLFEHKLDYNDAEEHYKKVNSISTGYNRMVPLITYYYRQKDEEKAKKAYKEREKEWKKEHKNTEYKDSVFWSYQLQILKYDKKLLKIFENTKTKIVPDSLRMEAYFIAGNLLLKEKSPDYGKAKEYFRKAKPLLNLQIDSLRKADIYYSLGKAFENQDGKNKLDSTEYYYNKALNILEKNKDSSNYKSLYKSAMIYNSFINSADEKNSPDYLVKIYFDKSLKIYQKLEKDQPQLYGVYESDYIAVLYNDFGIFQSKKGNYKKADSLFDKSLNYLRHYTLYNPQAYKEEAKILINKAINLDNEYWKSKSKSKSKKSEDTIIDEIKKAILIIFEYNKIPYENKYNYRKSANLILNKFNKKELSIDNYNSRTWHLTEYTNKEEGTPEFFRITTDR